MINNVGNVGGVPSFGEDDGMRNVSPPQNRMASVPDMTVVKGVQIPLTFQLDPGDIADKIRSVLDRPER